MRAALAALLLSTLIACGGGDSGSPPPSSPDPNPNPGITDPCASVRAEAPETARVSGAAAPAPKVRFDGSPQWRVLDAFWIHRQASDRRRQLGGSLPAAVATDIGDIAVLQDQGGDLITPAN